MDKLMLLIAILFITHLAMFRDNVVASYTQPEPFEPNSNFSGLIDITSIRNSSLIHARDQWSANPFPERPWNSSQY